MTIKQIRSKLNALGLCLADDLMDRVYGGRKRMIYRSLPDTVVEIGPGAGANMRYYPPNTRVIAIEPNHIVHPHLKHAARKHRINLEIRSIKGEQIDLPDQSTAVVVGTLVLCSVEDPQRVLAEIHRILKPGGRYIYLEHVADIPGTLLSCLQKRLHSVWHWLFEGCHLNRATHQAIQKAGFRHVEMNCFSFKSPWLPFAPHIFGTATK